MLPAIAAHGWPINWRAALQKCRVAGAERDPARPASVEEGPREKQTVSTTTPTTHGRTSVEGQDGPFPCFTALRLGRIPLLRKPRSHGPSCTAQSRTTSSRVSVPLGPARISPDVRKLDHEDHAIAMIHSPLALAPTRGLQPSSAAWSMPPRDGGADHAEPDADFRAVMLSLLQNAR